MGSGRSFLEELDPFLDAFLRHEIGLVQNDNHRLPKLVAHYIYIYTNINYHLGCQFNFLSMLAAKSSHTIVPERVTGEKKREPSVDHLNDNVRSLAHTPQLPPRLNVVLYYSEKNKKNKKK